MDCCNYQNKNSGQHSKIVATKEATPIRKSKISFVEWVLGFAFAFALVYIFTKMF